MTPFLSPQTIGQQNYNRAHIATRNTVERQYGVLKRRFPVLATGLRLKLENSINVILACSVLHNICIDKNEDVPPVEVENIENDIQNGQMERNIQNGQNNLSRDILYGVCFYFRRPTSSLRNANAFFGPVSFRIALQFCPYFLQAFYLPAKTNLTW
ncbi:unnamed protein product [Acanthoscelides obtectus]|uniref:DDE Tnp4 domain-containing protein n=1 Tax=Acanthoscelides obtectus TaxID=200917 RepID=A0A9P0KRP7_ACAOB|nr:unnamed protein product [Acanthoscelides obtectus]CAK1654668.1 Putative nuclease HARBI1 [Acanthoscelides obtectus]